VFEKNFCDPHGGVFGSTESFGFNGLPVTQTFYSVVHRPPKSDSRHRSARADEFGKEEPSAS